MSEASKAILTKVLAILGFCVTIALIIWLIIAVVSRAPGAFNSLANIADSINLRSELSALEVESEKDVVNSGEPFSISWTDTKLAGTYQVGYACAEGMAIFFRDAEGTFRPMRCGEQLLPLPATVTQLGLIASSTKDRFTDVTFRVLFAESTTTPAIEGSVKVTVVNAAIPVTTSDTETDEPPTASPEDSVDPEDDTPAESDDTTSHTPAPVPPRTVTKYVYPQSDPNGHTDLSISIKSAAAQNSYGQYAVTFMIKNIGTKTSNTWSFFADLPGSDDYVSTQYASLKPQEYMIFTMGFPLPAYTYGEPRATYTVSVAGDTNLQNNTAHTVGY